MAGNGACSARNIASLIRRNVCYGLRGAGRGDGVIVDGAGGVRSRRSGTRADSPDVCGSRRNSASLVRRSVCQYYTPLIESRDAFCPELTYCGDSCPLAVGSIACQVGCSASQCVHCEAGMHPYNRTAPRGGIPMSVSCPLWPFCPPDTPFCSGRSAHSRMTSTVARADLRNGRKSGHFGLAVVSDGSLGEP
jgi:hypothetical protein